jgi:hypothetical protein
VNQSGPIFVGDFRIPDEVAAAIASGEWKLPADDSVLLEIFTECPSPSGKLYSIEAMARETTAWWSSPSEEYALYGSGEQVGAGYRSVDPRRLVIFGDLGIDMPIAFDYQFSAVDPRVVYLPSYASGWIEVAPNAAAFLAMIQ